MFNLKENLSDPVLCQKLLARIHDLADSSFRFMEVCGTHTVSLFRSGIISVLPKTITHLSGPGCPVCVTHDSEIAAAIKLAESDNVHITTFGDLMRVPGPTGTSLKKSKAEGAQVSIVYSPLESLEIAGTNKNTQVVFLGVGFETTSPAIAATVLEAKRRGINNFSVLNCHKLVPPALHALLSSTPKSANPKNKDENRGIDGFLLPGHVSTILGVDAYAFLATQYKKPCVIAGFEPADLLRALALLLEMQKNGKPEIKNEYTRAVHQKGNPKAREIMFEVFETADARWRGIGNIPQSGLAFRSKYKEYDAAKRFGLEFPNTPPIPGCMCGEILAGLTQPPECPLFGKLCIPQNPVGPCMVSTEGSCAAYYNYSI